MISSKSKYIIFATTIIGIFTAIIAILANQLTIANNSWKPIIISGLLTSSITFISLIIFIGFRFWDFVIKIANTNTAFLKSKINILFTFAMLQALASLSCFILGILISTYQTQWLNEHSFYWVLLIFLVFFFIIINIYTIKLFYTNFKFNIVKSKHDKKTNLNH